MSAERALLKAVLEALTLPYSVPGYDRRMLDRADWARTAVKGALQDGVTLWDADYLREKLRKEEARHGRESS
ncbi:hypothetical protein ACJ6WF_17100 [Streptomyces sp. MMS24-I2-30]|uniref:hypothetical protein n=1 Tax=Streptomyces sp. MMS24-I2-30 TaxID=3351564 RepID=UPI0038968E89